MKMYKGLMKFIKEQTPSFNPDIAGGFVVKQMEECEQYLHAIFKAVLQDQETLTGFRYIGFNRVSVEEAYQEETKSVNNRPRVYDLARSDTYYVRLKFEYDGEVIEKMLRLPYVRQGGLMKILGTIYHITPVMSDKVISIVPPNKIFVRLVSVRLVFERGSYGYLANDVRCTYPIIISNIYKSPDSVYKANRKYVPDTVLVYYLLCKFGLAGMFKHLFNLDIVYSSVSDIETRTFKRDEFIVCKSTGIKPDKLNISIEDYVPSDVAIVVPISGYTNDVKSVLSGVFYILDQFTDLDIKALEDTSTWKVVLGKVLFGERVNIGKLIIDVDGHMGSVEGYLDSVMKYKFRRIGMKVDDIYDLFQAIISNSDTWRRDYISEEGNLYNKELSVLYYLLNDLIVQMVRLNYALKKAYANSKTSLAEVRLIVNRQISTDKILYMAKDHGELTPLEYSGDNVVIGLTTNVTPQSKSSKTKGSNNKGSIHDPSNWLHPSSAEVTTFAGMSKAAPNGTTKLNPYLLVNSDGEIKRNESLEESLEEVWSLLKRD